MPRVAFKTDPEQIDASARTRRSRDETIARASALGAAMFAAWLEDNPNDVTEGDPSATFETALAALRAQ